MLASALTQEQSYSLLSKTECLFAAIWHNPEGTVETEDIAKYYEVSSSLILDTLILHQQEFEREVKGDNWTPRSAIRLGMLLNSPMATNVRSLALDVIEAQKCKTKRDSIMFLLQTSEFVQWSDREISKILQCSPTLVGQARKELESGGKIVKFERRKHLRNGKTIERENKDSNSFMSSSGHEQGSNPDSTVETPKVKVTSQSSPFYGQECEITGDPKNGIHLFVKFAGSEKNELIPIKDLDAPSASLKHTPKPRTYTEEELQEAIACAIQEASIGDRSKIREDVEKEVGQQIAAAQAIANQKAVEVVKLQQKIEELESLRTLEVENSLLKQRIQELENAMEEKAYQQWGNTFTKQAEKVINAEIVKTVERLEPELHLRALAITPPPRSRYKEVSELIEKAADLLDRVPLIGRRVFFQGRYGTLADVEDDAAVIDWDERRSEDSAGDSYPLNQIEVLPTIEGIAKGSFVAWSDPKHPAYNYQGEVVEVHPRTGEATVYWRNTTKTKRHPISGLRLIRVAKAIAPGAVPEAWQPT